MTLTKREKALDRSEMYGVIAAVDWRLHGGIQCLAAFSFSRFMIFVLAYYWSAIMLFAGRKSCVHAYVNGPVIMRFKCH